MVKTVVVVEDNPDLRNEIISILEKASDIQCLYAVDTGEEALELIPKTPPDIVLMDIQLPGITGVDCIAALKKKQPSLEIIVLTVHDDAETIFQALRAGANGFLRKSNRSSDLLKAIRDIYNGASPLSGSVARKIIRHFHIDQRAPGLDKLSPREKEILDLLAAGLLYKEIASDLGISKDTVRTHIRHVCTKLRVRGRVEALTKYLS